MPSSISFVNRLPLSGFVNAYMDDYSAVGTAACHACIAASAPGRQPATWRYFGWARRLRRPGSLVKISRGEERGPGEPEQLAAVKPGQG